MPFNLRLQSDRKIKDIYSAFLSVSKKNIVIKFFIFTIIWITQYTYKVTTGPIVI